MEPRGGLDLLKEIRDLPDGADIRFVLVTPGAREPRLEAARLAGADAHLIKPFNRKQLLATIEQVFEADERGLRTGNPAASRPYTTVHGRSVGIVAVGHNPSRAKSRSSASGVSKFSSPWTSP